MVDNSGLIGGGGVKAGGTRVLRTNLQKLANKTFSVGSQSTNPYGITFSPDGTKMVLVSSAGTAGANRLLGYTLSTAWDVNTASYDGSYDPSSQAAAARSIQFNGDGTKAIVMDVATDSLYQYTVGTAYDITTISGYDSVSYSVTSQEANPFSFVFGNSGNKMFVIGSSEETIFEYDLSTPYLVSSASYSGRSFDVKTITGTGFTDPSISVNSNGTRFYVIGANIINDQVIQINLSTAWDISSASDSGFRIFSGSIDNSPTSVTIGDSDNKIYVGGNTSDTIWQFNLDVSSELAKTIFNLTSTKALITAIGLESPNGQGLTSDVKVGFLSNVDGAGEISLGLIYSSYTNSVSEALQNPVYYPYIDKCKTSANIKAGYSSLDVDAVVFYNLL